MPTSGGKSVNYYSNGKMKGMHIKPQVKAARLSFSTVRMARDDDDKKVNVNLIPDVDSFTLTSVGFGLIAFNFLILANVSCHLGTVLIRFLHLLMIPFISFKQDGRHGVSWNCCTHNEYFRLISSLYKEWLRKIQCRVSKDTLKQALFKKVVIK